MDEALLDAFRTTDYLVCLDEAEWATIRIEQPLPEPLQKLVGQRAWGFITAWHPQAQVRAAADNRAAQRELLDALRACPDVVIRPAIAIGDSGWHEPSLFAIGPEPAMLDALARRHRQAAYVHGAGSEPARLRLLRACASDSAPHGQA